MYYVFSIFFFKQKTAYDMRISDWSSDVCSSDLLGKMQFARIIQQPPPFLVKEHHRDRCDRLGHRINAIDRIGPNLRAVAKVQLAVKKAMHRPAMAHEQHVDTGDLASRYMVGEFGVHRDQCGIRGVRTEWSLHSGSPMANAPLSDGGDRKSTRMNSSH